MSTEVNHTSRAHALLAASHASRWINCTPSARLEEDWEQEHPSESSVYAEEGTLAHEIAEVMLRGVCFGEKMQKRLDDLKTHSLYSPEMDEYVEEYVEHVQETLSDAKKITLDAILIVEKRLDFSHVVKDGFGTGDACIIADDTLHIIDLKYGKGVKVDSENNPQLMLYALGALKEFDIMFDIKKVSLHIVQPRLHHISVWTTPVSKLNEWATQVVVPAAEKAFEGKGVQKAGSHCKFCKVKAVCATLASSSLALSKLGIKNPHLLTDKQLMEAYEQIPALIDWANSVNEYVLKEAVGGKVPRGYKIVEGRSQRKWSDENTVIETLKEEGFSAEQFMKTKLAGIGEIEKLVGKKNFPDMLGELVVKPQGAPTLVKDEDPRPAMQSLEQAKSDFSE